MTNLCSADTWLVMKRSGWVLAAGGIAGLLAVYLVVTTFVRDQVLQFTRAWHERNDGAELAHRLVSTESLLDYSALHPEQVALASWEIGDEGNGIYFNAARAQPAANASALLVLAAYASEADPEGHGDAPVSLARWERYWMSGTDGGAHLAALLEARANGALRDEPGTLLGGAASLLQGAEASGSARLHDVVRAMVRHADPAATDVLIDHLGRTRLNERVLGMGFAAEALPLPASGVQLTLLADVAAPELLARFRAQQRGAYADATWAAFLRLRDDDEYRERSLAQLEQRAGFSLRDHAELTAALAPRGTAGAYARLLQQIISGELSGSHYMRAQLDQPLPAASERDELEQFGGIRGSEPGVYTSVIYGRARGGTGTRVTALMLRKLPIGVWLHLSSGYLLQRFETALLSDPLFVEKAKTRLMTRNDPSDGVEAAADIRPARGR